jgi:MFS family permease
MTGAPRRLTEALSAFKRTLQVPNLRRAQLSFGADWSSWWGVTVAVGILAFHHGGAAAVGIVGVIRMLPAALLAPVAGVVVDRYRRERVLVGVGLVRAAALGGAALVVWLLGSTLPAYALVAVAAAAHTLYRPAHSALLPSICTTATELTSANVVRGLLDSLSALVGPALAGVLVGPIGVAGVFAVCAAAALWSAWLIARVDYEAPPRLVEAVRSRAVREAIEGVAVIGRWPDVRLLTILGCLQTFTRGCFAVFSVVVALQLLGLHDSGVGLLTAGFGAGAVLGSLAISLLVRSSAFARWLAVGIAGWGIPFIALAATSSEVVAIALLAVVGVANAIVDVSYFTLLQWLVPDELMGRVFSSDESLLTLGVAAGSLAAPGLIAVFGIRGALIAAGLLAPVGTLLALSRLRALDTRMQTAGDTVAFLQRVAMLAPLPLATITSLAASTSTQVASPGRVVIEEGTVGDDFYVIAEGQAEVLVHGAGVRCLGPGDCFGEIAALTGRRRTSTVRANTELHLLRFHRAYFVRAVTGYTPSNTAASALVEERLAHAASQTVGGDAAGIAARD